MFAGEVPIPNARTKTLTNKVFEIDFNLGYMQELIISEPIASRRCHACCLYGDYFLIFGGISSNNTYLNELCAFNINDKSWQYIDYLSTKEISIYL
jgi:hypothetical protein